MLLIKKLQATKFPTHRVWFWKEKISELLRYLGFDRRFKTSTLIAAFKTFKIQKLSVIEQIHLDLFWAYRYLEVKDWIVW